MPSDFCWYSWCVRVSLYFLIQKPHLKIGTSTFVCVTLNSYRLSKFVQHCFLARRVDFIIGLNGFRSKFYVCPSDWPGMNFHKNEAPLMLWGGCLCLHKKEVAWHSLRHFMSSLELCNALGCLDLSMAMIMRSDFWLLTFRQGANCLHTMRSRHLLFNPHQRRGYSDSPFARKGTFLYCRV